MCSPSYLESDSISMLSANAGNSEVPVGLHVFDPESCSQIIQRSHLYHRPFLPVISTKECSKYANVSITQTLLFADYVTSDLEVHVV